MWVVLIICITIVALKYLDAKYSCKHKWTLLKARQLVTDDSKQSPVGHCFILQCEKCGEIEEKKTRIDG